MDKQNEDINDRFSIDALFRQAIDFRNSAEFAQFFNFIARFRHYSRYNTMLVYLQNRNITFFGSRSYWRKHWDRGIRKGARPYLILTPGGPVSLVFDVMETTGYQDPEAFLEKGLGRKWDEVKGNLPIGKLKLAIFKTESWGVPVLRKPLSYFEGGHITTLISGRLDICIKEGASDEENFSVLVHELAHLLLGHSGHPLIYHKGNKKTLVLNQRQISKPSMELEAETVSFLICCKMGLETRSAEYLASYISQSGVLEEFSYEQIIKTADRIEKLFM